MKHLKILGGLLIAYTLNSCGILPDALPDETQSGKNTFGCLINGKVFIPSASGFNKGYIAKNYDGGRLLISGQTGDGKDAGFGLDNVTGVGIYNLKDSGRLGCGEEGGCSYGDSSLPLSGQVEITKFERGEDKAQNLRWLIVSGKFEGVIVSDIKTCKDTMRITQGRFDVKFQ